MIPRKKTPGVHHILVPIDFSSGSSRAMKFALTLSGPGCRVTAAHAVDPFPYRLGPQESMQLKSRQAWVLAQESMARWLQEGKFSACDSIVIEGEPAPAIINFADVKHADLIVLATSARAHAARLMLGSVAEEIFRGVACPVVVLGPKVRLFKRRKMLRLVFATDLEPHSLAAVPRIFKFKNNFSFEVLVIRAVHPHIKSRSERSRIRMETRFKIETAIPSRLRKHIKQLRVEFDHPVKAITAFATARKADAIIMAIRSGGELRRASTHIPWTVAHRVIAKATCPVLTIRG